MRIASFTNISSSALLIATLGLAATVIWGLKQLEVPYRLSRQYYDLSLQVSLHNKQLIAHYLQTGNAVDLASAESHLQQILDTRLSSLPENIRKQVRPAALALLNGLHSDLRAAGKLSGNAQGLLMQNEREFGDLLEDLNEYAEEGYDHNPALAFQYLHMASRLSLLQQDRALLRQRFFSALDTKQEDALVLASQEISVLTEKLSGLPRLGVMEKAENNEDELFFDQSSDDTLSDRGDSITAELNYLARRYPSELKRTEKLISGLGNSRKKVNRLVSNLEHSILQSNAYVQQHKARIEDQVRLWLAVLVGLIFLIGVGSYFTQRRIVASISNLVDYLRQLRKGDFSQSFSGSSHYAELSSLSRSANQLQGYLHEFVHEIRNKTHELSATSTDIGNVADNIQQISRELRSSTGDASSSVTQLVHSFRDVADNANQASLAAVKGKQSAQLSSALMGTLSSTIDELSAEVETGTQVMQQLQDDSRNIEVVLNVIEGVAEQTSLLALNAAIESARAGEMGRGFAVVADEVRQLAQRTAVSTKEVQTRINNLVTAASNAVVVMENQRNQANRSVEHTHEVTQSLQDVVQSIDAINGMNAMIAQATEEQVAAASSISDSVDYVNRISEQTAEGATITQQRSKGLHAVSSQLSGLVEHFRI